MPKGEGDDSSEDDDSKAKSVQPPAKQNSPATRKKDKAGVIGHFISNKPMVFDNEKNQLVPWEDEQKQKPRKLIDLNVLKKGVKIPSITDTGVRPFRVKTQNNHDLADSPSGLKKGKPANLTLDEEEDYLAAEEAKQANEAKLKQKQQMMVDREKKRQQEIQIEEHREVLKGEFDKKEDVEGKLRMSDVTAMPEEIDEILGYLQNANFNI